MISDAEENMNYSYLLQFYPMFYQEDMCCSDYFYYREAFCVIKLIMDFVVRCSGVFRVECGGGLYKNDTIS